MVWESLNTLFSIKHEENSSVRLVCYVGTNAYHMMGALCIFVLLNAWKTLWKM